MKRSPVNTELRSTQSYQCIGAVSVHKAM